MKELEETTEKSVESGENRQPDGTFGAGNNANPGGRLPDTPEQKIIKKATKLIIAEYREKLAEALPRIEPVLVNKAIEGDIQAIKEVHDRAMGKAPQTTDITSGGKPIPILGGITLDNSQKE